MPSAADICNLGLGILGVSPIMSLAQKTVEAEACARVYPLTRDFILAEFNWRFATKDIRLSQLDEEIIGPWTYAYSNPSDCLRVQMIHDMAGLEEEGLPFSVGYENRIYTNVAEAIARCTMRVTNEGIYPLHFVDIFSKRLAVDLAGQLQNIGNRMTYAQQLYEAALPQAVLSDASLGKDKPERIPMLDARTFGLLPGDMTWP